MRSSKYIDELENTKTDFVWEEERRRRMKNKDEVMLAFKKQVIDFYIYKVSIKMIVGEVVEEGTKR